MLKKKNNFEVYIQRKEKQFEHEWTTQKFVFNEL